MPSRKDDQGATDRKKSWLHSFRKSKPKQQPDDPKREQQLQAYVSWVNSHLRKKPGCRLVEDLKRDMIDGITLVNLVETLSGQTLVDIERVPLSSASKKENTEKVLKFMTSKKIRMHHTTTKDILDGNIKSIMRLILALAAFFKQRGANPASSPRQASKATPAADSLAQSPPLIYANPSAKASPRIARADSSENPFSQYAKTGAQATESIDASWRSRHRPSPPVPPRSMHHHHHHHHHHGLVPGGGGVRITRAKDRFREVDLESSVCSSMGFGPVYGEGKRHSAAAAGRRLSDLFQWPSPDVKFAGESPPNVGGVRKRRTSGQKSPEKISRARRRISNQSLSFTKPEDNIREEEVEVMTKDEALSQKEEEAIVLKKIANLGLQDENKEQSKAEEESDEEEEEEDEDTDSEGLSVLLEQRDFMENQLGVTKEILYGLQHLLLSGMVPENAVIPSDEIELRDTLTVSMAEKDQLRHREDALMKELEDAQEYMSKLEKENEELRRASVERESTENALLRAQLLERNAKPDPEILKAKLAERTSSLEEAKSQLKISDTIIDQLQKQLDEATRRIVDLQSRNESVENQLEKRGCHIKELQSKLTRVIVHNGVHGGDHSPTIDVPNAKRLWPIHKDIEIAQIEVRKLKSTLQKLGINPTTQCRNVGNLEQCLCALTDKVDSLGSPINGRKPRTHSVGSFSDIKPGLSPPLTRRNSSTKVVYFTERSVTPFLTTIPRKLGEICLRDFKKAFDRSGSFRYHFKTIDPDYGAVKQEVTKDDDIIPGWEGRIVVWIEEDSYV
ncbi:dixin-like isoform X2 [Oscarella lobularis]|uniref:dixin-like isoform X2 n=1 Tax=Oscarella lobularis TaxID=121494 RepID=UPI0033131C9E